MNDRIKNWKDITWQIRPTINMPQLDPEAVQFAVLDSDPIEDYRKSLMRNGDGFRKEVGDEKDSKRREQLKRTQMTTTWDLLFKATTGDLVYLLVPSRSKRNDSLARAFLISSNDQPGRKWLTTKIAYRDGSPICWSIPVDTIIGKSVDVELKTDNLLDLQKLYDEVIGHE